MDDDGEYNDGDIVWVKLSYCWWPGEVMAGERLTDEFLSTLKRRPLAVVKFFDEDSYEFVKNTNFIYKYNCSRKHEFLRKGLEQYRAKNKHMEKFPSDVMHAERATGGDPNIVNSTDFLPQKRESYANIFGDKNKGRASVGKNNTRKVVSPSKVIPVIPVKKHVVRILGQASSSTGLGAGSRSFSSSLTSASSLPSTPRSTDNTLSRDITPASILGSPSQIYHCHKCGFETGRQNVIVVHTKYCRAVPLNIPSVKVVTPDKNEPSATYKTIESPRKLAASTPKSEIEEKIDKIAEEDELVEVIQVVEPVKPTRGSRGQKAIAVTAKSTPKTDRRKSRGRGRNAAVAADVESEDKVEVLMEVGEVKEESSKEEEKEVEKGVEVTKSEESFDKDDSKDSKGKAELKNELLADWSEDEQDDPEDSAREDELAKNDEPDMASKADNTALNSHDTSLEKSVDCSPQLASPMSSGTTIKYRNIPKKQKREFIEVTNDQPTVPVTTTTVEKSSSESSVSTTAATCGGDTISSDKTPTYSESFSERPISAKQRILDRATRGSSKSISSDETKLESPVKAVTQESQSSTTDDESKKETSCFDFQEDEEEEEVVLNKSPRRSLSNRRDTSLEMGVTATDSVKEQEDLERAKQDAELKNKVDSLLCETSLPSLPEIPTLPKAPSPGPSSSTETTPNLKDEIDRNRTLPPKERGKRIFKTRNKTIENDAIAFEQSKAIVMDFVKKSHEEEMAELLEQQRAEAKLCSESPTTTNDDSQESIVSGNEPTRFENSEFAAIKSKRTKISQAEKMLSVSPAEESISQEPSVSSTNETKATETEAVSESLATTTVTPKGRKGKQKKSATPVSETPVEEIVESELPAHVEDATPKGRKKRNAVAQSSEPALIQTTETAKPDEPASKIKETTPIGRKKRGADQQGLDTSNSSAAEIGDSMEKITEPHVETPTPKGNKKRAGVLQNSELLTPESKSQRFATVVLEKLVTEDREPEPVMQAADILPKSRKKRGADGQSSELTTPDTSNVETSAMESPEAEPVSRIETKGPKGRKKRSSEIHSLDLGLPDSLRVEVEKPIEESPQAEKQSPVVDATPKNRKKRGSEAQSPALDTLGSPITSETPIVVTPEKESVSEMASRARKKKTTEVLVSSDELRDQKPVEEMPESELPTHVPDVIHKGRKKRGVANQSSANSAHETLIIEGPIEGKLEKNDATGDTVKKHSNKENSNAQSFVSVDDKIPEIEKPIEEVSELDVANDNQKDLTTFTTSLVTETQQDGASTAQQETSIEETTPKVRRRRGGELDKLDLTALDTPRSRRGKSAKAEDLVVTQEEPGMVKEFIVASTEKHRKSKRTKKDEEEKDEAQIPSKVVEEPNEEPELIEESTIASTLPEKHRKSKRTKQDENERDKTPVEVSVAGIEESKAKELAIASTLSEKHRKSRTKKDEEEKDETPVVDVSSSSIEKQKEEPKTVKESFITSEKHPEYKRTNKDEEQKDESSVFDNTSSVLNEPENDPEYVNDPAIKTVLPEKHRKSKRAKQDETLVDNVPSAAVEVPKEEQEVVTESVDALTSPEKHRKSKRTKLDETSVDDVPSPAVEESKEELKATKSKRSKQRLADSTAEDITMTSEPSVPVNEIVEQPHLIPVVKQQPIKMIIKSRGRKSNSELLYEPSVVTPDTKEDEVKEKLPKSPKSSKRKKTSIEEPVEHVPNTPSDVQSLEEHVSESNSSVKSPKQKRSKFTEEPPKPIINDKKMVEETPPNCVSAGPTDTDLQIAEALIHLPDAAPPKPVIIDQELVDAKSKSSTPVLTAKTINPRKRHLQSLMNSPELAQPVSHQKPAETVSIPEKKKRDTVEVVDVAAPVNIVLSEPVVPEKTDTVQLEEDKFDIDNIPIVMDDSELLDDSTISTTTSSQKPIEETAQQISVTNPMTKKMVIVKNSNGSAKIVSPKEFRKSPPKKSLAIKSSTIAVNPSVEQLSPKPTRSPTHSPPIRGAQLVQASSVGQIVITSKGTVFTTQSATTSTPKSSRSGSTKTHVSPAKTGCVVSSVSSLSTISSSTSKSASPISAPASHLSADEMIVKSPAKICVQSQEIIHPPAKSTETKTPDLPIGVGKKKTSSCSISPPKKVLMKKHTEANSSTSSSKPLFSTSKGDPITPQPATSSAVSPGKKAHKVIKISPQKLKEFTRLGMVEDKGQGKVLTASGMKKFRQEQHQLQKQQRPRPEETRKPPRTESVDEEPSTSTPTPPPPSEAPAEVVVAAAADSSVKEIPPTPVETEEVTEVALAASSTESIESTRSVAEVPVLPEPSSTEENEADAAINEPEAESSNLEGTEKEIPSPPVEAIEAVEFAPVAAVEAAPEASESGSNVQESSQLIAVPAENFGGPSNLFYLCSVREEGFVPVNNELLYLDSSNQLVALPEHASVEDIVNQAEVLEIPAGSEQATVVTATAAVDGEGAIEVGQQNILLNTQDGQQIILDQQSLMALAAGGDTSQLLTPDGQQILLQGSAQELLAALAVSQPGLGIVAAEGTQIIVAPESLIDLQDPPLPGEIIQVNPNTTVETNAVLTKPPIMSAVEVPTKNGAEPSVVSSPEQKLPLEAAPSNLDESLAAVIGVPGNPNVPTSLELPITVTNPVIAKTTTSKINPIYPPTTAISAIAIDPAVAAAAATGTVIDLPTVAQTDSLTTIKSIWD